MSSSSTTTVEITSTSTTTLPTTPKLIDTSENKTDIDTTTEAQNVNEAKPKPRLLNLSVDELQNFANALHNQTEDRSNKKGIDLSDVTLDDDEDEPPRVLPEHKHKDIPDKFYTNLQAPFHHLLNPDRGSDEVETCKENEISYKVGERMDRGCEESCECTPGGVFECSPRCKHPYIRRGRRLNDPLCFESPVDDCCSIMACATGNGDIKPTKVEVCRYGNETYAVGTKWNIGCEQSCTCEPNSIVTCKPRCNPLPPSEKCINVQDPNDACCEIQVCDVSHDVHEEPSENITSSTTKETNGNFEDLDELRATMRPLVLAEPIGSVKVLHNNSVQVNLMHLNNSEDPIHLLLSSDGGKSYEDVELKYSNLILDLEGGKDYILKTKETGTKFNFTITASNAGVNEVQDEELVNTTKAGCFENGQFYAVGEEFHIGCEQLCECTGPDTRECAEMICPSHVGLELMSKGCVKWAPNPPAQPPNCCPRSARCLSDGTCHYNGIAVPNWSEVPLSLTGCERRCYCENGVLDCQEVCAPLPPIPPQTLRCPPLHHPTPVNISDEDCCKRWACVPNGQGSAAGFPMHPAHPPHPGPSFLPTVPPEKRYPQEGVADYDDIHRPVNSLEPNLPGLPPEFTVPPHFVDDNKKLTVISIQADSPTSIKMLFGLPPLLVGLRGSIDLRYTDKPDEDVSKWNSQVFAPADEVLTTPRLEFRLTDLKPSTTYKIRGKLYLHNLPVEPESGVYIVHTPDLPTAGPVEEKRREIDSKLTVVDVNVTTAHVSWRHFDEDELQFIDAIQVRYRPVGTPIYSMTELLHHSRSTAELHDLRPGSTYEAALVLVPPPKATTELHDPGKVEFTTAPFIDPYNWTVVVEARAVGSEAVEVMWRGVPAPAERWVRVYRAAHACGGHAAPAERREHDDFRLAARDLPATITLTGLEPNSSRGSPRGDYYGALVVVGVVAALGALTSLLLLLVVVRRHRPRSVPITPVPTAPRESSLPPYDNPAYKLELQQETMVAGSRGSPRGDYYGALVVVGVVAALGALTSLLLLLVVVRRHRPRSVPITPVPTAPRESSLPPYDNPAYKLELQQETMDL
ncbi:hypothetical protein O3G_MSEX014459 [Manduca sexta]|uniref:Fibronectin type-III domain-containing protein n=1 Tax=Manduca sexta TaxID=7130 RepID=A0A921ZWW7_MANSE|nr:hypothetical protein O3G_MSEX014459 [Manduca sexta]